MLVYEKSFPRELEYVKKNNIPVVIPAGTVEYHGPQCAYGCDTLVAEGLVKKLAERKEIMLAPTISYSPSSYAVGDEKSGTVHVEERAFENYVYYVFWSMLCAGIRNIYVVIHHQFEQESEMPMTLCYRMAAKRALSSLAALFVKVMARICQGFGASTESTPAICGKTEWSPSR